MDSFYSNNRFGGAFPPRENFQGGALPPGPQRLRPWIHGIQALSKTGQKVSTESRSTMIRIQFGTKEAGTDKIIDEDGGDSIQTNEYLTGTQHHYEQTEEANDISHYLMQGFLTFLDFRTPSAFKINSRTPLVNESRQI